MQPTVEESQMPVDAIGRTYAPGPYLVGREKIREYARAIGERNALHLDLDAARAAGFRDLVAPPMFVVVYARSAISAALFDPALGIDFEMLVHGGQEFQWDRLVIGGDEIETVVTVADLRARAGMRMYTFESISRKAAGEQVSRGIWKHIVRERKA